MVGTSASGLYIIEDVELPDMLRYREFFERQDYVVSYINMFRPSTELSDNSLIVVRRG